LTTLKLNIVDFISENEAICETGLGRESGPLVGLIDDKTRGSKISCNFLFKGWIRIQEVSKELKVRSKRQIIRD
jgi:hypothetical protein